MYALVIPFGSLNPHRLAPEPPVRGHFGLWPVAGGDFLAIHILPIERIYLLSRTKMLSGSTLPKESLRASSPLSMLAPSPGWKASRTRVSPSMAE